MQGVHGLQGHPETMEEAALVAGRLYMIDRALLCADCRRPLIGANAPCWPCWTRASAARCTKCCRKA